MRSRLFFAGVFAVVLCFALVITGCAASGAGDADLYESGIEMIMKMDELASSEAYVKVMSASQDLADVIAVMAKGEYSKPKAVYKLSVPEGALQELIFSSGNSDLPEELGTWLDAKTYASIPAQMAARAGTSTLAAMSCVTYGQALMCKKLTECTIYLYLYDGDYSAMVTFVPGQDGAVSGTAYFVLADDVLRAADSEEAVLSWINGSLGYLEMTAEKVR